MPGLLTETLKIAMSVSTTASCLVVETNIARFVETSVNKSCNVEQSRTRLEQVKFPFHFSPKLGAIACVRLSFKITIPAFTSARSSDFSHVELPETETALFPLIFFVRFCEGGNNATAKWRRVAQEEEAYRSRL